MKTLLGIFAVLVALCGTASATDCHRVQRVVAPIVEYHVAPLVEYQIVTPHQNFVLEQRQFVYDYVQPQRVRVIQENRVKRPVVVRERIVQKNVKQRNFSRQRVVERNVQAY